jgi:uncharacterized small protein (DUF1192 family)
MKNESSQIDKDVHCPTTLLNAIAATIVKKADASSKNHLIRGIFNTTGVKEYNGYYYDKLEDINGKGKITLKMPTKLRHEIEKDSHCTFKGVIDIRYIEDKGVIEPTFIVTECYSSEKRSAYDETSQKLAELLQKKNSLGFRDVRKLLKSKLYDNKKPCILMVYGSTAIVDKDVETALGSYINSYDFIEERINLNSKEKLLDLFESSRGFDAIAIIRGGGSGLEIFDDIDIATQSINLKIPLLTAIGHAVNKSILEKVADLGFPTPTSLGNFLKDIAKDVQEEKSYETAKEGKLRTYQEHISTLNDEVERLKSSLIETEQKKKDLERSNQEHISTLNDEVERLKSSLIETEQKKKDLERSNSEIIQQLRQKDASYKKANRLLLFGILILGIVIVVIITFLLKK